MPISDNPQPLVGLTSTIPMEIVFAAGLNPVDLNNIFISSDAPDKLIAQAESAGFTHNICAWIKGIYSVVLNHDIRRVIAVTGGDCSNTVALGELLEQCGVEVIHFDYPLNRDRELLFRQMDNLRSGLSTTWEDIERVKTNLDGIRDKLRKLDLMTFQDNVITGYENHLFLVNSSDFNSDPEAFERDLDRLLLQAAERSPRMEEIRLGYLGVPPIFAGFYELIESMDARVVFNETQRQFSMPYGDSDIVTQYLNYTYPYQIQGRLRDISRAVKERGLDGLIHYTQTFCYRQIYDIILREHLRVPILTIEGDRPGKVDGRTTLRIETFIEMLRAGKDL